MNKYEDMTVDEKRQAVLDYVLRFHNEYGYGPSVETIANEFGYAGVGSIFALESGLVTTLIKHGYLAFRKSRDGRNVRNTLHVVKPVYKGDAKR